MLDQAQKRSSKTESISKKRQGYQARVKVKGKWFYISTFDSEAEARGAIRQFHRLNDGSTTPAMICMRMQTKRPRKPKFQPPYYKEA